MSDWWSADPIASPSGRPQITIRPRDVNADAIAKTESGGRYDAIGPETGKGRALGKYQVMDFNIGPWSREALGRELTPLEFISSPEAQEAVFAHKFGQYVQKYGPDGAARAWFAGEGGMNNPNARDILGTSVADYAAKFNAARGQPTDYSSRSAPSDWWANDPVAQPQQSEPAMQGPPRAQVGMGEAIVRGVQQGASFNFGDELAGLSAASGIPEGVRSVVRAIPGANIVSPVVGAARMGLEYLTGGNQATDEYNRTVEAEREANKQAQEQRPYSYGGGNLAGAVALPVGGALQGATLPIRMARGAAVGGAAGALSGAGEGEGALDRAGRATIGAALGGAIGGVAPPVVEGVLQTGNAVVGPAIRAVRGATNPETEAARRVATAIAQDMEIDPQAAGRVTAQEFAASRQSGGPVRIMDLGGEATRELARSARNTSPEGADILNRTINDRFEGQSGRIINWLRETFHYPNVDAQQQALQTAARAANRPAYARAYQEGRRVQLWTDELEQLAQAPEVQAAIRIALPQLRNWAVRDGFRPPVGAFQIENGRTVLRQTQNGNTILPSLQLWDYVKRALDGMNTPTSRQFAQALRTQLDELVPSYQQARQGAAHFFGAENALEAGQNFVTQNFAIPETRRALASMSEQERRLFQDGFVSRFIETLERVGDRRNVLNQIAASPAAREKLRLALGPQVAAEMEVGLRVEGIIDLARTAVQGNSTTARQLYNLGLAGAGGVGGYGIINQDPQTMTIGAIASALAYGGRRIDQNVARRVAEMLVSNNPQVLLRGIRAVARSNTMMDNLRVADRKIASVGAQETPKGLFSAQGMVQGRAESDQNPNIEGPRR